MRSTPTARFCRPSSGSSTPLSPASTSTLPETGRYAGDSVGKTQCIPCSTRLVTVFYGIPFFVQVKLISVRNLMLSGLLCVDSC